MKSVALYCLTESQLSSYIVLLMLAGRREHMFLFFMLSVDYFFF